MQGSYTVEMAFVFPIVFFVIISLIYMAFYMHDKTRVQCIADSAILYGSELIKHERAEEDRNIDYKSLDRRGIYYPLVGETAEEEKILYAYVQEKLEKGLMIGEVTGIQIYLSHKEIEIHIKIYMKIGILRIKEIFLGSGTCITIVGKGDIHYPAEFVRQIDVIEGIIDEIQGYDKLMKALQKQLAQ